MLLFLLAGVWVAFLLPPLLRKHSERSADSISSFRQQLSTLERTTPAGAPGGTASGRGRELVEARPVTQAPSGRSGARRRRRDILFTLAGASVITLVLGVMLGGLALVFHGLADLLLTSYLFLLVHVRKNEADRAAKVRYLPGTGQALEPALLMRRSASS